MTEEVEASPQQKNGARLNLNVDVSPNDCYLMCKQLFMGLEKKQQQQMILDCEELITSDASEKDKEV